MAGSLRTKPRTMWLSKFSSLSSRSNPTVPHALHESFAHAAPIRVGCLDTAEHVCGLDLAAAHVLVDLLSMGQAISEHGIYLREAQRVVGLDDRLGSRAALKRVYHDLQQYMGVAYA